MNREKEIYDRDKHWGKWGKQAYLNSTNASKFLEKRGAVTAAAAAAPRGRIKRCSLLPSLRVCEESPVPTDRLSAPTNNGDFSLKGSEHSASYRLMLWLKPERDYTTWQWVSERARARKRETLSFKKWTWFLTKKRNVWTANVAHSSEKQSDATVTAGKTGNSKQALHWAAVCLRSTLVCVCLSVWKATHLLLPNRNDTLFCAMFDNTDTQTSI